MSSSITSRMTEEAAEKLTSKLEEKRLMHDLELKFEKEKRETDLAGLAQEEALIETMRNPAVTRDLVKFLKLVIPAGCHPTFAIQAYANLFGPLSELRNQKPDAIE